MKYLAGLFLLGALCASGRNVNTINDGWMFSQNGENIPVHLPHCWNTDAYSTEDYFRGAGQYTRTIQRPEGADGKRIYLQIDGAANKSDVRIDGLSVGSHIGAYSTHFVDVTEALSDGQTHQLTIEVDNSDPAIPPYSADFTFMGGLYRDVSMVVCNPTHLDFTNSTAEGFKATQVQAQDGSWTVNVSGKIISDDQVNVRVSLGDIAQKVETAKDSFDIVISNIVDPALWSPEHPNLYELSVVLEKNGEILDRGVTQVGFRTFGFNESGQFLLNGEPYKLRGMCRHQDQAPMGIALTDPMHRRDIKLIKDLGANFIRISHYPQDDAVLEMCDRLGLIAWEEVPVIDYVPQTVGFAENAEIMVRDMIRRHYNHPSVAMWGYMNEILLRVPGEGRTQTLERTLDLAKRLEEAVHQEDAHRLTSMAFHGSDAYHEAGLADITDVQGWNLYQGWYGGRMDEFEQFLSRQHREHPDHKLIVSEYGAGSDRRLHSLDPQPFDFSTEYQQRYLEHYLPVIEDSTFVAGASHWNFIDFSSAKRAESMPHINNKGMVTNARVPKDVYYYYKAMWHDAATDTVAHIAVTDWPSRTEVPDEQGRVVRPIKCYTNLPEVTLRINGVLLPALSTANCVAVFSVDLKPGKNLLVLEDNSGKILDVKDIDVDIFAVEDGLLILDEDEFAVNVGSNCYFTSADSGLTWLPDREYTSGGIFGYVGGTAVTTQDEIALTSDQPLLQRGRSGLEEYRVDVAPGYYEVELLFAEQGQPSAASAYMLGHNAGTGAERSNMDIHINGSIVEKDFSPADSVGSKTMLCRRYFTDAVDNAIVVKFSGTSSLAGIKIRKL